MTPETLFATRDTEVSTTPVFAKRAPFGGIFSFENEP